MTNDLNQYLDTAKAKSGSDYRTAQALGLTRAMISKVRAGHGVSEDTALLLADYIGADPLKVIAASNLRRTKSPALRKRWEEIARGTAAAVFLAVAVGYSGPIHATTAPNAPSGICIMRLFRRWLTRLLTMSANPRIAIYHG